MNRPTRFALPFALLLGALLPGAAFAQDTVQHLQIFHPRPAQTDELVQVLRETVAATRSEPGHFTVTLYEPEATTHAILLMERFVDEDALIAHERSPHAEKARRQARLSARSVTDIVLVEVPEIPSPQIPTPVDAEDTDTRLAVYEVEPEQRAAFLYELAQKTSAARVAPGNLGFNVYQVAGDPHHFLVFSSWDSAKDHTAFERRPEVKHFATVRDHLLDNDPREDAWDLDDISLIHD